jgi:protease YdgD
VFDMGAGRPRIVSLISRGARSEDGQTLVWGMDAARAVPALKAALRAGRGVWPAAEAAAARRVAVGGETAAPAPETRTGAPRPGGARFVRP